MSGLQIRDLVVEYGKGADKVALWSSFEGVVMISEPASH